jgi:phenylalanyl-tRNA synthetase beta chain
VNASLLWLSDFVGPRLSGAAVRDLLTARVATVDAVEPVRADLAALVVGRVVSADRHPDSDHLSVVRVDAGGPEPLDVICGAPNVTVGGRYPFAPVGTVMPGGLKIERRKIRGHVSNGMLCSARELGLGTEHQGILLLDTDAAPGTPLLEAVPLGDTRLVVDVLPNRPDLLSHQGLAREIAAAMGRTLREPVILGAGDATARADPDRPLPVRRASPSGVTGGIRVTVDDPGDAPAYLGVVIRGIRVGPSPAWLVERLGAAGVRSISNVVDATNYMLHGFGQPMHAFDLGTLAGAEIRVRRAVSGERIRTLDGVDRALDPSMIVIADASRPLAIAGVIGGAESAVSEQTTAIFLEIASFDPRRVRSTRRALGVSTDASYRFERLVPPTSPPEAVAHAIRLVLSLAGGAVADDPVLIAGPASPPAEVLLRVSRVAQVLGIGVPAADCATLLGQVGFRSAMQAQELLVTPPPFRTDVVREIDLVEEIARLYGYDRIPGELRAFRPSRVPDDPLLAVEAGLRETLVGLGFLELRAMPFTAHAPPHAVRIVNPLVQTEGYLRTTLLETLARRAEYNLSRAAEGNLRLFEIGTAFVASEGGEGAEARPVEEMRVAALVMGARRPPHFTEPDPPAWDEWDAKALGQRVAEAAFPRAVVELRPATRVGEADAARGATPADAVLWEIVVDGTPAGRVVRVALDRPAWATGAFGVELTVERVATAPVAPPGRHAHGSAAHGTDAHGTDATSGHGGDRLAPVASRYRPVPAFPASWVDVTLLVPDGVASGDVQRVLLGAREPFLEQVELISEFRGGGIPPGRRSLTWRLTFRDPLHTLVEKQVEARRDKLLRALETELGVRQRTS